MLIQGFAWCCIIWSALEKWFYPYSNMLVYITHNIYDNLLLLPIFIYKYYLLLLFTYFIKDNVHAFLLCSNENIICYRSRYIYWLGCVGFFVMHIKHKGNFYTQNFQFRKENLLDYLFYIIMKMFWMGNNIK